MGKGKHWNDAAHARLLLAVIKEVKLNAKQYDAIAARLGDELTGNAIRCHVTRLAQSVISQDTSGGAPTTPTKATNGAANSVSGSPLQNGKTTSKRKVKTSQRRKRKQSTPLSDPESSDFELENTPPPKRVKTEIFAPLKIEVDGLDEEAV